MAYRDPYTTENQYGGQPAYNPYEDLQPHAPYEHAGAGGNGYHDEPFQPPAAQQYSATRTPGFEKAGGFVGPPVRQGGAWDAGERAPQSLWTRGSRVGCIGRFCCCFLFTFVFLLISVVLALALFIRPPNIVVNGVIPPKNGSQVQVTQDPALQVNMLVNISVNNPNYFGVNIKSLDLDIKYPVNNTDFGGGSARDIVFGANSAREFDFPFAIKYKPADDPQQHVLADLATKCGVIPGSTKSDLTINYKIDLALSILGVTVRPSVSNSFKFACPDITAQMAEVLKDAGLDLPTIFKGLNS